MVYSKKAMAYFRHPKNQGEIKNADGVGKVGNIMCLLPKEMIHSNPDTIEISRLSKNDKVLGYDGKFNLIANTSYRKHKGKVIELKNKLGKVALTPEHLVYAIKIPGGDKYLRNKGKKELIPAWYHAEDLKKGDIVLYPIPKEKVNAESITLNIPRLKWDFKSKELPNKIPIEGDFLRLCGYYLSEGCVQDKPCRTYLSFSFHINEKDLIDDVKEISKRLFLLDATIREYPKRKTAVVQLYSAKLARIFKKLFGKGAKNKRLPEFMLHLPAKKQQHLINGLWKGDGYVNLNRDGPRAGYTTISYHLAQQMKILLLRQKIVPSIYQEQEKTIMGVKHKKSYRIHVGQRESLERLCKILGIAYRPKSYESVRSWFDSSYLYTPISGIKRFNYSGNVHNLEVKDSHSFTSEAFCLHNCGDVMWLYIVVKKDKITDIKFKTFGCVAAIATSSMVTELAKGKTIEEALKITNLDVAKSLGGLPPVKMHCSVLAQEALNEAVYDYLSKNNKPIPENVMKRHERVKKDLNSIEKRYKTLVKSEEKVK